ncbi:MAG TPA: hypothetical protein ENH59_05805 [Bacteroidetes bacterium]|nr:hypothetical protein [Bacteroidota bacterium]
MLQVIKATPVRIRKITSGGQSGVDRAALDAAPELGLETGGWCPPGRVCEGGIIPRAYNPDETNNERFRLSPPYIFNLFAIPWPLLFYGS